MSLLAQGLEEQGAHLYVAIAPNKATIYPDGMPGRYPRYPGAGNIRLLEAVCRDLPLTWVCLLYTSLIITYPDRPCHRARKPL